MKKDASRIINGTWGEAWIDGELVGSLYGLQAKISLEKSTIKQCGSLMSGKKTVSAEGTGSVKSFKVDSTQIKRMNVFKSGNIPTFTIVVKLADPDALGAERVMLTGVTFDDITLFDFEAGVEGKQEMPFSFEDYELLDIIEE